MKVLLLTFKGLLVLSVPVFLIIIASDIVIKTRFIYEYDFWRYEISEKTSIELTNLRKIGKEIRTYFQNNDEYLSVETTINNQMKFLFNQREIYHMKDVKNLINLIDTIGLIIGCVFIIFSFILVFHDHNWKETLLRLILLSGLLSVFLVILISITFLVFFDYFFVLFHEISFSNDLWILNPKTDYLIMLFPESFFRDATYAIGLLSMIEFLFIYFIVRYFLGFKLDKS
ncbi:MAG: TIGR01906 family membrane protein [Dehalococcoidia bacterium]|jgi:integral membrane protein (TIGR01906 family)|nr:TIGR01906 family membrane protein [Dehalococcoidia bacterium]